MNIADEFFSTAKNLPNKVAIRFKNESKTFSELENDIHAFANGLSKEGSIKGKKVLVFLRPGLHFPAIVFSLFKVGAIPVFIDPGMGLKNLLQAVKEVAPEILIAEPIVFALRILFKNSFISVTKCYTTGPARFFDVLPLSKLYAQDFKETLSESMTPDELCAILFTSGGTGVPKGVEYTHRIFSTQTSLLKQLFNLTSDDIDIPGFPLFSLFALNMGMTSCPPPMNPSKPSKADPKKLVDCINKNAGSFVAGSPAIWEKVADYCIDHKITLPTVKYLVMFGAPVAISLHEKFKSILTKGTTYTPYGATESLPVACISGNEILAHTAELSLRGNGTCVGKIVPTIEVKIITPSKDAIPDLREVKELTHGEIGEIIVSGDTVTARYYKRSKETARAKIYQTLPSGQIRIWHRIGDMGHLDQKGLLWFCGRATHAVELNGTHHYSIPIEAIFNSHRDIKRTALIEHRSEGETQLGIVVERKDHKILRGKRKTQFEAELFNMAKKHPHTQQVARFFHSKNFPVDVRHNIKIDRLKLRDHFNNLHGNIE